MVSELCPDDLKKIYPDPTARVVAKARPQVDIHARKFIEMSPFCVLATSGSDGSVEGSGFVQLIFFVPGIDETLRVGGKGTVSADPALLSAMEEFGRLPRAALCIDVFEAYFHCGKALMRSKLWSKDTQIARATFPSISQVIHDQTKLGEPEPQAAVEARYKTQL